MVTINKQTNSKFTLLHTDAKTNARAGVLATDHGDIETPIFMPVGTLGSVKGGVSYRVNDRINVFGNVGWLFGSDYENVSANFGLNYAF